ncbi:DUF4453 domain-containing protein [Sinisalibacter aestuarii]|uniref:YARHG domain-containing protein n=1 Tax=Sinisalibacter aestuarii TaxID=2949426 RepID=A0ABQ5LWS0_9RHOB|nr:DUF4453 domain-containing protein [Sinisalibacter aestuarii]GKY88840.1 hypothetical protein STA1M1_27090 [Sinisalibacter aestuarii]
MNRLFAALALALAASPASAQIVDEYCNDYWLVRNQAFNMAGYCFGSALGQALFDNSDCIGQDVALSPRNQTLVARIRDIEGRGGCHVDTSRTSLPIPLTGLRLQLTDLAARDEHSGAGCFGWTGAGFTLWSGFRADRAPLGAVQPGDDLIFLYDTRDAQRDWYYVEVERGGVPVGLGWSDTPMNWDLCTEAAG